MIDTSVIRDRFTAVEQDLNERSRRLLAAAEAKTAGHGGIAAASRATGVARSTIGRGMRNHCICLSSGGSARQTAQPNSAQTTIISDVYIVVYQIHRQVTKKFTIIPIAQNDHWEKELSIARIISAST